MITKYSLLILCLFCFLPLSNNYASDRVIYGIDNRTEVLQTENELFKKLAESTAMMVDSSSLLPNKDCTKYTIQRKTFGEDKNMCADQAFVLQMNPGLCSGFLVAKNIFVTAGHCFKSEDRCTTASFIFGYHATPEGLAKAEVNKSDVYTCKRVIAKSRDTQLADFAIIELDREVIDREPLAIRTEGKIADGQELVMIGHPTGLPTKIDDGGIVRKNVAKAIFEATTDSFYGNSGSAVFDRHTGIVEGILVRGDVDFIEKVDAKTGAVCNITKVCEETACTGEDITRTTELTKFLVQ